tara:strand:+ start:1650 stop:2189 length:540 start_codon:yes stop_codon:yes gene_type:complete
MTEQVVDIRDRIEKMRNQMTGGSSSAETEPQLEKKISQSSVDPVNADYSNANSNKFHEPVKNSFQKNKKSGETEINIPPKKVENEIRNEDSSQQNFKKKYQTKENKKEFNPIPKKIYENYERENTSRTNKQSIDIGNEKQPFPQFSLNVSNPISWKLMLLIMLMQLLTNIMLVVVLYLK